MKQLAFSLTVLRSALTLILAVACGDPGQLPPQTGIGGKDLPPGCSIDTGSAPAAYRDVQGSNITAQSGTFPAQWSCFAWNGASAVECRLDQAPILGSRAMVISTSVGDPAVQLETWGGCSVAPSNIYGVGFDYNVDDGVGGTVEIVARDPNNKDADGNPVLIMAAHDPYPLNRMLIDMNPAADAAASSGDAGSSTDGGAKLAWGQFRSGPITVSATGNLYVKFQNGTGGGKKLYFRHLEIVSNPKF